MRLLQNNCYIQEMVFKVKNPIYISYISYILQQPLFMEQLYSIELELQKV